MIHRFDIFEMAKPLQVNLTSNSSLMQFTADTALSFYLFRPEEYAGKIGPRPLLILHSAGDSVTKNEEAFSLVSPRQAAGRAASARRHQSFHVR
jgi:uncharacterized protein